MIDRIKRAYMFAYFAWLAPLILYLALPFDIPVKYTYFAPALALGATAAMMHFSIRKLKAGSADTSKLLTRGFPLCFYIGIPAGVLTALDLLVFRGVNVGGDIGDNRDQFINSAPSALGYLSYVSGACCLLSLTLLWKGGWLRNLAIVTPYLLTAAIYLVSGNRQFFILGIVIIYFTFCLKHGPSIKAQLSFTLAGVIALGGLMISYQFARQSYAKDSQLELLENISQMTCDGALCKTDAALPTGYLFQYFGNIYHGLSFYILNDIDTPMFSTSVPILYKRLESLFDLESSQSAIRRVMAQLERETGVFPNFWKSMYGYLLSDFGWLGTIAFCIALAFLLRRMVIGVINKRTQYYFSNLTFLISLLTIGVMFLPTVDPIFSIALAITFFPKLWLPREISTVMRNASGGLRKTVAATSQPFPELACPMDSVLEC